MERLRMEDVVTQHPPESRLELGPQERGAEPQVLVSVHVRVRHGGVPLRPTDLRARDVYVLTFPRRLPLGLDLAQVDRSRPALRPCPRARARARPQGRDRKSTRLNSSHGYISYAVFCLKKKKKKQERVVHRG